MLFGETVILLAIVPFAEREVVAFRAAEQRVLDGQASLFGEENARKGAASQLTA